MSSVRPNIGLNQSELNDAPDILRLDTLARTGAANMKVSKKSYYGLRAVVAIAGRGEMSAHDIAVSEDLPEDYLEKILQILKKTGLLSSEKGAAGGYTLADPRRVTAFDVLTALEGDFRTFPAPPLTRAHPYPRLTHCQTNLVWKILEHEITKTLSNMRLSRLISKKTKTTEKNAGF